MDQIAFCFFFLQLMKLCCFLLFLTVNTQNNWQKWQWPHIIAVNSSVPLKPYPKNNWQKWPIVSYACMFLFFSALSALDLVSLCVELVGITLAMNFSSSIKYWSERSKTHKLPLLLCPLPLPGKESHSSPICFQWMLNRSMEEKSTPTTSCCCCFCSSIMFSPITAEIPSFSLK